jgi:riboflavin kinase/FMN adenylyltransferase
LKIYNHLNEFKGAINPVVTVGIFDGLHLGHQKILKRLCKAAEEMDGESVLLSFFPHPRVVLYPDQIDLRLLNTLDEKISLLQRTGIDHVILHPFSLEFSELTSDQFIQGILVEKIGAKKIIIGYDHRFGKGRVGSFEQLKKDQSTYGFKIEEIAAEDIENDNISSTKIRKALATGDVMLANQFLGYNYFLRGTVVPGEKIGRNINFPTANLYIEEKYKLIPCNGVYAVLVRLGDRLLKGMMNIGNRPTLPGREFSMEVHILDFNEEIYREIIQVELIERIRDEKKFDDLIELESQLKQDKEKVISILK